MIDGIYRKFDQKAEQTGKIFQGLQFRTIQKLQFRTVQKAI